MRNSSGMFLSQRKYASEILEMAHMVHCNPCRTPIDIESKLGTDGDLVSNLTVYRSFECALQYLTFTRLDISYAIQQIMGCSYIRHLLHLWLLTQMHIGAEVEYRGVANVVVETCCIVYLSSNPFQPQRTKHIEIDIHFVYDLIAAGQVRVLHVPSRYQYADIFTQGLAFGFV
ncbi:ribonuclease H-like domain-containing protein [Tanacetum coccineum]|uniref:Ribonuclease H-like domain-containing protein n=1 Tax=Tanacetum coccineum TaxID=301880 RepID=A0ABQ5F5Y5_9ASTR